MTGEMGEEGEGVQGRRLIDGGNEAEEAEEATEEIITACRTGGCSAPLRLADSVTRCC